MTTSEYWTKAEIKQLRKQNKRMTRELEFLRERDVLREKVKRQKKEKFYRSKAGKLYLASASALRGLKREATSPRAKKTASKIQKDLTKLWNQI